INTKLVGTSRSESGSPACHRFWDMSLSCGSLVRFTPLSESCRHFTWKQHGCLEACAGGEIV
ncbi:hypothetical protein M405DRAFT_812762, partial [Rhizopogon salebrosus TDB-379]